MNWRSLKVWQESHALVLEIYKTTSMFPKAETYGLKDQLRRAACSVPANIVEGQSRNTTKEYMQYLYSSRGSLEEVRYFLLLSKDLNVLSVDAYEKLENGYEKVSKMLNGLINSLKRITSLNP